MEKYREEINRWLSDLETRYAGELEAKEINFEAENELKFKNPINLN